MTLVANVLNAVGGTPVLDTPGFIPALSDVPAAQRQRLRGVAAAVLAAGGRDVHEDRASGRPRGAGRGRGLRHDRAVLSGHRRRTEAAVRDARRGGGLHRRSGAAGDAARLFDYRGSGRVVPVYDLASALVAIDEIEEQGEGLKHAEVWDGDRDMFHPEREEVAHYFRFMELQQQRSFTRGDTPESGPTGEPFDAGLHRRSTRCARTRARRPTRAAARSSPAVGEFNLLYSDLLRDLHRAFNGEPGRLFKTHPGDAAAEGGGAAIMQMPTGDGTTNAGPTFEYMPPVTPMQAANAAFTHHRAREWAVPRGRRRAAEPQVDRDFGTARAADLEEGRDAGGGRHAIGSAAAASRRTSRSATTRTRASGSIGTETAPTTPSATRARRFVGHEDHDDRRLHPLHARRLLRQPCREGLADDGAHRRHAASASP